MREFQEGKELGARKTKGNTTRMTPKQCILQWRKRETGSARRKKGRVEREIGEMYWNTGESKEQDLSSSSCIQQHGKKQGGTK